MSVIDAHQHFWWMAKRAQPFPTIFGNRLARDYTPADLLPQLRAAGIDGTILVQSLNDLIETIEYLDLADAHDFIKGVVGWVPLDDFSRVRARTELTDGAAQVRRRASLDELRAGSGVAPPAGCARVTASTGGPPARVRGDPGQ